MCVHIYLLIYASQVTLNVFTFTAAQAMPMIYPRRYLTVEAGAGYVQHPSGIEAEMSETVHVLASQCVHMYIYKITCCMGVYVCVGIRTKRDSCQAKLSARLAIRWSEAATSCKFIAK